ncbi:MAG: CvpA family protein [Peptostreptococcales bacterium]
MNVLDIVIIAIFVAACIQGYIRGFITSVISFGGWIIAAILAFKFSPFMTDLLLEKTTLYSKIAEMLNSRFSDVSTVGSTTYNPLGDMNLPKILTHNMSEAASTQGTLGGLVATILINVLSVLIIFIGVKLVLYIIGMILNSVADLPVLKQANKLGGVVFGLIKGGIIIYLVLAIMVPVVGLTENTLFIDMLSESTIGNIMYHNNILLFLTKAYF